MKSKSAMGKLVTVFLLTAMLAAVANGRIITMPGASPTAAKAQPLHAEPKEVSERQGYTLVFHIHEIGTGPNKTVWNVAYSENTLTSPSSFGLIQMIDSPITNMPELDSITLGRAQGTISYADLHKTALLVNWNIMFTHDKFYKGSSLNVLGRISASGEWRDEQLSIVGGTGLFSGAVGDAFSSYVSFNPSTLHRVSSLVSFVLAG